MDLDGMAGTAQTGDAALLRDQMAEVQSRLKLLGYYQGELDGLGGRLPEPWLKLGDEG